MIEVNPNDTTRASAFEMWMKAPMPMVTIFKKIDIKLLVKISRRNRMKLNALMCYIVAKAASQIDEFFLLPVDGKLMRYDSLAVSVVVNVGDGEISTCDVPYSENLREFYADYINLTDTVRRTKKAYDLSQTHMVIGTSALTQCDIDGVVNIYSGVFNNPFLTWGRYRKGFFKTMLPISFQFHHTQMDGAHAALFLNKMQDEINDIKKYCKAAGV